jgi:hypothetical protein
LGPLGTAATNKPIVPAPGDYDDGKIIGMIGKYSEKTCPNAALSITNPTCCPDANTGRRGGKPVTNRLSCSTAISIQVTNKIHVRGLQEIKRRPVLSRAVSVCFVLNT